MNLIYVKDVDKSLLFQGFTIKASLLDSFLGTFGRLEIGEMRQISVLLNGKVYSGIKVINQRFDRIKYPDHPELYQVRYDTQHEFILALRSAFPELFSFINEQIQIRKAIKKPEKPLPNIKIPDELRASLSFYSTDDPNVWEAVPVTQNDYKEAGKRLYESAIDEVSLESMLLTDPDATIVKEPHLVKVRKLDYNVCKNLKELYGYRCQVCGQLIMSPYGEKPIADAHHIAPFVKSLNNNYSNVMVLCPNHHRVVHTYNPVFHSKIKIFEYPNGYREGLFLNKHL